MDKNIKNNKRIATTIERNECRVRAKEEYYRTSFIWDRRLEKPNVLF